MTSNITWFHLNHDIVSRRIYKLSFYGGHSITSITSAGYTGGRVNIQAVSFPGDTRESIFHVRHGEILKKFIIIVDGGI